MFAKLCEEAATGNDVDRYFLKNHEDLIIMVKLQHIYVECPLVLIIINMFFE